MATMGGTGAGVDPVRVVRERKDIHMGQGSIEKHGVVVCAGTEVGERSSAVLPRSS